MHKKRAAHTTVPPSPHNCLALYQRHDKGRHFSDTVKKKEGIPKDARPANR